MKLLCVSMYMSISILGIGCRVIDDLSVLLCLSMKLQKFKRSRFERVWFMIDFDVVMFSSDGGREICYCRYLNFSFVYIEVMLVWRFFVINFMWLW